MKRLHLLTPLLLVALAASVVAAQQADTIATTNVAEGVTQDRGSSTSCEWICDVPISISNMRAPTINCAPVSA
jgi:hypothetical protein